MKDRYLTCREIMDFVIYRPGNSISPLTDIHIDSKDWNRFLSVVSMGEHIWRDKDTSIRFSMTIEVRGRWGYHDSRYALN